MGHDRQDEQSLLGRSEEASNQGADLSRRKFTKAGLIAAPVVMSLGSRPALGAGYGCTISGMLSGNLSHPDYESPCWGNTPGYWKQRGVRVGWPSNPLGVYLTPGTEVEVALETSEFSNNLSCMAYDDDGTMFGAIFDGTGFTYFDTNGEERAYTMMQILMNGLTPYVGTCNPNEGFTDRFEFGAHAVAAYLNACASLEGTHGFSSEMTFGLTPEQVVSLYNSSFGTADAEAVKTLFQMWNENNRDADYVRSLLGGSV